MSYNEFTPEDQEKFRAWFVSILRQEKVLITFTKKDGTERKMRCTLNEEKTMEQTFSFSKKPKEANEEVQPVFDIEVGDWRSFRWDSIKMIEFTLGD